MTVELTHTNPLPYSRSRHMEAQEENTGKKAENKAKEKIQAHPDEVAKALREWEKFNAQRKLEGKEATEEEKAAQARLAKKGKLPPESNALPLARFKELERVEDKVSEFEDLADEIEEYRKAGLDVSTMIRSAKDWIRFFSGKVPGEKVQVLNDKLDSLIREDSQKETGKSGGSVDPVRLAWEAVTKGITITEEERALIEQSIARGEMPVAYKGAQIGDEDDIEDLDFSPSAGGGPAQDDVREEALNQFTASYGVTTPEGKRLFGDVIRIRAGRLFNYDFVEKIRREAENNVSSGRMPTQEADAINRVLNEGLEMRQNQEREQGGRRGEKQAARLEQIYLDCVLKARTKSIEELKKEIGREGGIRGFLKSLEPFREKPFEEESLDQLLEITDKDQFQKGLEEILNTEGNDIRARVVVQEMGFSAPSSIQEIAYQIMAYEGSEFRTGGKYPMFEVVIDKDAQGREKPRLEFQQHNFIRWARNKMINWHESNPDDPGDMFKVVGVFGSLRPVSLGEMIYVDAFFRDKDTGKVLSDLRTQLIYEAWPFNSFRNFDIEYRNMKGSDEKLPESLQKIYMTNVATKKNVLNKVFNMADISEKFKPEEKNSKTGQGLRMALLSYYYLGNFGMIDKIFKDENGNNLAFLDFNKFKKQFIKAHMDEDGLTEGKATEAFEKSFKNIEKYFDENGKLKNSEDNREKFMVATNLFNSAMTNIEQVDEIRERVRLSIMERFGISYNDAKYAENFAYSMTRWTGIATLNDINAVGFDAWSKVLNTGYYLQHQSSDRRGGAFGNRYTMFQFKRLGLDFFTGVTDVNKKSILEWIQGGQGDTVRFDKHADGLLFGENTMTQFYANHINRSFQNFHSFVGSKALKLNEIVFTDREGFVHTDPEKFDELYKEGFLKPMRYAYSTWPGIDFTEQVSVFEEEKYRDENGEIKTRTVWKTQPLARRIFGKMMFNDMKYFINGKWVEFRYSEMLKERSDLVYDYYEANKRRDSEYQYKEDEQELKSKDEEVLGKQAEYEAAVNSGKYQNPEEIQKAFVGQGRGYFWREAAKVRLAAEIKEARKRGTLRKRMTFEETENFISILEQMDANMEGSEEGFEAVYPGKKFFSKDEIKWIRKQAGVGFGKMFTTEIGMSVLEGTPAGFFNALWALFTNTFKSQ